MDKPSSKNSDAPAGDHSAPTANFYISPKGPGSKIGQFRIECEIGRGGAGVVYLARDTKLDRKVAIKSLPPELVRNPQMRSRLKREAKLLASLDHPNIATIHDIVEQDESGGYLILEYIPGDTLAERISQGPLDLRETLSIAQQIAEAVAAAHEHNVIHRDLKPGNIKITREGKVKVLDFGLAKAVGAGAADQQSTVTEPGRVIGTPAYMSPEQARGQATGKRTDIWSFGCVLYEMLTRSVPFAGQTVSDTLANILQQEPDWRALPEGVSANIQVLLRCCLEKDLRRRLRDIGDAALEIHETLNLPAGVAPSTPSSRPVSLPARLRQKIVWAVACVLPAALAATVITRSLKRSTPMPTSCFPISLPRDQTPFEQQTNVIVSPDGKKLVYAGGVGPTSVLFLKELGQIKGKELPDTKGALQPFFSPDGRSIGFQAGGKLTTLSLEGGRPKSLCDVGTLMGASWGADGMIYFCPAVTAGLYEIPADGGAPELVTTPKGEDGELGHWWPEVLPGDEAVLFTIWKTTLSDTNVGVLSPKTGQWRTLLRGASYVRYAPSGHLIYAQSGTIMAAPFDLKQLKVGKARRAVIEGLKQYADNGYAPFSFSQDGLLYYVRGGEWLARRHFTWVGRLGEEIEPLPLPPQAYCDPALSPDGQRIAFTKFDRGSSNIWVYDLPDGPATQVTFESSNFLPIWTPKGDRLTFTSYRAGPFGVYWMPADGSSGEEPLVTGPNDQVAASWSPDGTVLLFTEISPVTGYDIWSLSIEDGSTPRPLICESAREEHGVFSPDGNWIAYESDREGRTEVYVSPYPKPAPRKISTGGGSRPKWSADGKELFYRNGDKMMAVAIETQPALRVANPRALFEEHYYAGVEPSYDVSQDGQRFLMLKESLEHPAATQLIVVLNWFEELKRLVPPGRGT